jgi:hypothetical protein
MNNFIGWEGNTTNHLKENPVGWKVHSTLLFKLTITFALECKPFKKSADEIGLNVVVMILLYFAELLRAA